MVRQLMLPIKLVPAEIVRAPTGLALSSRNGYLTDPQRIEAAQLHATLAKAAAAVKSGATDYAGLEGEASDALTARGWGVDYIAIRRQSDLGEPSSGDRLVVLGAARLGGTRLIDNQEI
jgi:pantoate--beta-alanine ligase